MGSCSAPLTDLLLGTQPNETVARAASTVVRILRWIASISLSLGGALVAVSLELRVALEQLSRSDSSREDRLTR